MKHTKEVLVESILRLKGIRYVCLYVEGKLISGSRDELSRASSSESDRYEEILVNPTLLLLAKQRGEIDCGGCQFVLVRYGNFYQLIKPVSDGHISICIEATEDPLSVSARIDALLEN